MGTPGEEERQKKTEEIFKTIMTDKFPRLISDITDPGNSENIKQRKWQ